MTVHDAVVLGLGIHGSATVRELARRGRDVVGVEQFGPAHARGSSHGATRMIRRAYPSPVWNDLVDRAFRGWERWAAAAGEPFVHPTGGLYAHRGAPTLQGGRSRPVEDPRAVAASLAPPQGWGVVHDPDAGVVEAARALAFAQSDAVAAGAELRFEEEVLGWSLDGGVVTVRTTAGELRARRLVLAAGGWIARLLPEAAGFFEVQRIVTFTARAGQDVARPPALGCFSVDLAEGLVFGLPEAAGSGAKIGIDAGPVWDPAVPVEPPTAEEIAHLQALLQRFVPGIDVEGGEAVACLYTMTPDKRFVVGELPGRPQVLVAAACSGHGFKFGPAVGEALADLVDGIDRPDLDFLTPARSVTPA
ncbi:FAD-dependent oxidoreductase [Rathayibacter sp. ZW T2_19]|uniref:FAD-dependent oxidoreductase n=1 Tax=Rathayibacter rubneri TaxID=2950106 RepID=A0A9X2DXZ3_9MICO|nr:FAD-dependent oxidoreductase [Rathayibacter rubneri]MCM6762336.1 FAD-dependent oxidoreductase [Rathayibacter rubneri]